ncbi:hypothetical protein NL676_004098 [Syzygium grande]|nr:hypothetical protein NL676_004098 [Syzygium grande]
MTNAYRYLIEAGGLEEESSYPYTGKCGECKFKSDKIAVRVVNFTTIPVDEDQIAAHMVKHGPLAVPYRTRRINSFTDELLVSDHSGAKRGLHANLHRGVSCPIICGKRWVNHRVLLVGYGVKGFSIIRLGNRPCWIIKNSWGNRWGEHGYYRLCRGHGMRGMNTMVSAVVTQASG